MRRREFIAGLGGAVTWPVGVRAQQPALPIIGYLYPAQPEQSAGSLVAFRNGLGETGFIEGRNATIEYRFAHNQFDRLAELATDLVRRRVAVIATSSLYAALAAKAATATIPIVFRTGADPVQYGLVASLNKPGGNITGINDVGEDLGGKRLGLLHDLLPSASRFGMLVDPSSPTTQSEITDIRAAASSIGVSVEIVNASTNREIDAAFVNLTQKRIEALVVPPAALFASRRMQISTLAAYHRLPVIYGNRSYAESAGLMSYGPNVTDAYRQSGIYTGRILKGEKPADIPVMRPTKFELVINLQTARTLGIEVPPGLLAIADEVIE